MTKYFRGAAAIVAVMTATVAFASVTFDPATGTGFVGKGDVQLAFGWNNSALQKNALAVTFSYDSTDTYAATCTWVTGEGTKGEKTHNVDHKRTAIVRSSLDGDPRQVKGQNQFTGFILGGYGSVIETGDPVPVIGGPCMGNEGTDGTWTAVEKIASSGGLYVNYNGQSILLSY